MKKYILLTLLTGTMAFSADNRWDAQMLKILTGKKGLFNAFVDYPHEKNICEKELHKIVKLLQADVLSKAPAATHTLIEEDKPMPATALTPSSASPLFDIENETTPLLGHSRQAEETSCCSCTIL